MEKILIFGKTIERAEAKLKELEEDVFQSEDEFIIERRKGAFKTNLREYVAIHGGLSSKGHKGHYAYVDDELPIWILNEVIYFCLIDYKNELPPVRDRVLYFKFR